MQEVIWISILLLAIACVATIVYFHDVHTVRKWRKKRYHERRQHQKKVIRQKNVSRRIRNALAPTCEKYARDIELVGTGSSAEIHIFESGEAGNLFGQRTIVYVSVDFINERPNPIFVRYDSTSACGWWSDSEENIEHLLRELRRHLEGDFERILA